MTIRQTLLAGVLAELLEVDSVGLHESFFDLGGHSLLAVEVMVRVEEVLGRRVELVSFYADPTVAGLEVALDSSPGEDGAPHNGE